MNRRTKIRILTFAVAGALTLTGLFTDLNTRLGSTETDLEIAYRRALGDLTEYVSDMRSTLQKAPYVGTGLTQTSLSAKLLEESGGAKAAMAVLPLSQQRTEKISRFLSQTGDYALTLSRQAAAGGALTDADNENLQALGSYAEKLLTALENAQARLGTEDQRIHLSGSRFSNLQELDDLVTLDDDFDEAAKEFAEAPSLLYDGPFSDHLNHREPLFLQDAEPIDAAQAANIAADFLECAPETLTLLLEGGDELPVYSFQAGDVHINITRSGGEIAYFKRELASAARNLDSEDALTQAARLLDRLGKAPYQETYYAIADNQCTFNFAGTDQAGEQPVLCYPDLLKVTVDLEQGIITEYDAVGYLMNRHFRDLPAPARSAEEAAAAISPLLTPESVRLALIPSPGETELLCWEYRCKSPGGEPFLTYINTETSLEEQLYRLIIDENGALAD